MEDRRIYTKYQMTRQCTEKEKRIKRNIERQGERKDKAK